MLETLQRFFEKQLLSRLDSNPLHPGWTDSTHFTGSRSSREEEGGGGAEAEERSLEEEMDPPG